MALSGERLRRLRDRRGLTQEELAQRAGIGLRLLQKYERGESDPSVENATRLADALDTTIDFLANRVSESTPYVEGDLTAVERLIIQLYRRRKLPGTLDNLGGEDSE